MWCVRGFKRFCQGTWEVVRMLQESYFATVMKTFRNRKRNHPKIAYIKPKLKKFYYQNTTFYQRYNNVILLAGQINIYPWNLADFLFLFFSTVYNAKYRDVVFKKMFYYGKIKGNFCARKSKEIASWMKIRSNKFLRVPSRAEITFRKRNMGHTSKLVTLIWTDGENQR